MRACNECPFIKRKDKSWRGYLSAYKDGMELHRLVENDALFKCHKDGIQICRGFALYMNGIAKRSRAKDTEWMQDNVELAEGEEAPVAEGEEGVVQFRHQGNPGGEQAVAVLIRLAVDAKKSFISGRYDERHDRKETKNPTPLDDHLFPQVERYSSGGS